MADDALAGDDLGEGLQNPSRQVEWYAGFLEFIALSINFGIIRALTNLYRPRNSNYQVLCAGRREYPVADLLKAGVELGSWTRFLVAPEEDITVILPMRCRDVLANCSVAVHAHNEFWGSSLSG